MDIERINSGRITKTTVTTNCRDISYLVDKFDTYSSGIISVVGDYKKKEELNYNEATDEIKFDSSYSKMKDEDIYNEIFGEFYDLILKYTNINIKFNYIMNNYNIFKQNMGLTLNCIEKWQMKT